MTDVHCRLGSLGHKSKMGRSRKCQVSLWVSRPGHGCCRNDGPDVSGPARPACWLLHAPCVAQALLRVPFSLRLGRGSLSHSAQGKQVPRGRRTCHFHSHSLDQRRSRPDHSRGAPHSSRGGGPKMGLEKAILGQPRWLSSLVPPSAQGMVLETWDRVPHRGPCMEPASPSA